MTTDDESNTGAGEQSGEGESEAVIVRQGSETFWRALQERMERKELIPLFPDPSTAHLNFSGLTISQVCELLEMEAKISLYKAMFAGTHDALPYGSWLYRGGASSLADELREIERYFEKQRPGIKFGSTFNRASRVWYHVPTYYSCLTNLGVEKEIEDHPEWTDRFKKGSIVGYSEEIISPWSLGATEGLSPGFWGSTKAPYRERLWSWIEEFTAELRTGLETQLDAPDLRQELDRLILAVRNFEPGSAQGKSFIDRFSQDQRGLQVLGTFRACKTRLLEQLEAVRDEYTSTGTVAALGPREKLKWNGSLQMLARVFDQHAEKGYFARPQTHGENSTEKLARMLLEVFDVDNGKGKPASAGALRKALAGNVSEQVKRYAVRDLSDFEEPRRSLPPEVLRR